jgi:hypothetical protein
MILDVDHAEHAGGGPGFVLVRIHGTARAPREELAGAPTLLIAEHDSAGAARHAVTATESSPVLAGAGGERFAYEYPVPLHLMEAEGGWFLDPRRSTRGSG